MGLIIYFLISRTKFPFSATKFEFSAQEVCFLYNLNFGARNRRQEKTKKYFGKKKSSHGL